MTALSVNVDHVATLRQARLADYPDPVAAARRAEEAGAAGITVHLRHDRRHIQDRDVTLLRTAVKGRLNLEIAAEPAMIELALRAAPDQVTLVPERPDEITTEGGLDLVERGSQVRAAARRLAATGIRVSVFVDPDLDQIAALEAQDDVTGFELNTDAYARAAATRVPGVEAANSQVSGVQVSGVQASKTDADTEFAKIEAAAARGLAAGRAAYAGHGLTVANVGPVAALAGISELNIGHSIVSRAVLVGMTAAVEEMLAAMRGC